MPSNHDEGIYHSGWWGNARYTRGTTHQVLGNASHPQRTALLTHPVKVGAKGLTLQSDKKRMVAALLPRKYP